MQWQLKKSEAGNKASKLPRVEINISIDSLKVIDAKSKVSNFDFILKMKISLKSL